MPYLSAEDNMIINRSSLLPSRQTRSSLNGIGFVITEEQNTTNLTVYWDGSTIGATSIDELINLFNGKITQFLS
jgi:hypothetical protein